MAERGVRWWLRLLLDPRSKKRVEGEVQDALRKGTDPKQAKRNVKEVEGAFDRLVGIAKKVAIALGAAFVLKKIRDFIVESTTLAARYETLGVVLRRVGENAGYSGRQLDDATKALQRAGISMIESRQSAARLIGANIDLAHSTDLARIAQNAAVIANTNSSEAFSRLIHGIASGQVEILRTLGLNVNFQRSYQKLARQLGRTVESLSETEKAQARTNAVVEAGVVIAGSYEAAMGTANKQLGSTARLVENLQVKFGTIILPAYTKGVAHYSDALQDLNTWLDNLTEQDVESWAREAAAAVDAMASTIRNMVSAVVATVNAFERANIRVLKFTARFGITKADRESARQQLLDIERAALLQDELRNDFPDRVGSGTGDGAPPPKPPTEPPPPPKPLTRREEITFLGKARELNRLTSEDIARSLQLEQLILLAMQDGNRTLAARVGLAEELAAIQAVSAGLVGQVRDPRVGLVDSGATAIAATHKESKRHLEEQRDMWALIEGAGMNAAFGVAGAWQDAFGILFREGMDALAFMEALSRGMAGALLGGLADFASGKVAENAAAALEAAAYALGFTSHGNFASASAAWASAGQHAAAMTAWAALAGAAGAAQGAVAGGGRGGLSGGVPTGARDIGGRLADGLGGQEVHVYIDPLDPGRPVYQRNVVAAGQAGGARIGNNVRLHVHPYASRSGGG